MQNYILSRKNRVDAATLTGGSYSPSFPLSRAKSRDLALKVRTTGLDTAAATFTIDFGDVLYNRVFGLFFTNFSADAEIRLEYSVDPTFSELAYDSGFVKVFDRFISTYELQWEDPNFLFGEPSEEDLEGTKRNFFYTTPENVSSRYIRCTMRDPNNPDGFVSFARAWCGPGWQFKYNPPYGAALGLSSNTLVDTSYDNVEFFGPRTPDRTTRFSLEYMDQSEAYSQALETMRKLDVWGEAVLIPNFEDPEICFYENTYGRLRTLNPIEKIAFGLHGTAFEMKEFN